MRLEPSRVRIGCTFVGLYILFFVSITLGLFLVWYKIVDPLTSKLLYDYVAELCYVVIFFECI